MKLAHNRLGFTLIELLVVIAIIGVLIAVILSINPVEQINKARDSQSNSAATELHNAIERYYTSSNPPSYPWNADTESYTSSSTDALDSFVFDSTTGSANWNWINGLASTQEIKTASANRLRLSRQFKVLHKSGINSETYVCFYPISMSMRATADKYCETNGDLVNDLLPNTCATTTGKAPTIPGTNPICVP